MYLTVQKESFHSEIQFKAVFEGGIGRKFEIARESSLSTSKENYLPIIAI